MAECFRMNRLSQWLAPWLDVPPELDCELIELVQDSRQVIPGAAFLALPGVNSASDVYVDAAIAKGATIIIQPDKQDRIESIEGVIRIALSTLLDNVGDLVHRFFGEPSQQMQVIGVTGTNGKSSVTHFIAQLSTALGVPTGVIGTLGYGLLNDLKETRHTTPPLVELHRMLAELQSSGCQRVAIEVSSHALDQDRVAGVRFGVSVLTNISRDHLDYHGTMDRYAAAKQRLFLMQGVQSLVLNQDDDWGRAWSKEMTASRVVSYGLGTQGELKAEILEQDGLGLRIAVSREGGTYPVVLPLLGEFNVANFLAACGALISCGEALCDVLDQSRKLQGASGRLEKIDLEGAPNVVVDYAHTPDALEKALSSLRSHCSGRLWCVFGCGGGRDRGKRAEMGRIACSLGDQVILTDDNPRDEDPEAIAKDILSGCDEGLSVSLVQPREKAILSALEAASPDDWVVVAGKGHEDYQEIAGVRYRFSDQDMVKACWQAIQSRRGAQGEAQVGGS